jgi:integrase
MEMKSLTQAWRRLFAKAGVQDARFHDLRHTFITRRVEAGTDILTLAEITGHRELKMLRRYYHASDDAKLAAVRG